MECRGGTSSMRRNVRSRAPLKYRKTYKAKVCWNSASAWRSLEFPIGDCREMEWFHRTFRATSNDWFYSQSSRDQTLYFANRTVYLDSDLFRILKIPLLSLSIRARIPFEFITFRSLTYATAAINDSISYR